MMNHNKRFSGIQQIFGIESEDREPVEFLDNIASDAFEE